MLSRISEQKQNIYGGFKNTEVSIKIDKIAFNSCLDDPDDINSINKVKCGRG